MCSIPKHVIMPGWITHLSCNTYTTVANADDILTLGLRVCHFHEGLDWVTVWDHDHYGDLVGVSWCLEMLILKCSIKREVSLICGLYRLWVLHFELRPTPVFRFCLVIFRIAYFNPLLCLREIFMFKHCHFIFVLLILIDRYLFYICLIVIHPDLHLR